MRSSVYPQFATVHEDSASLFDQKLNETIRLLKDRNPSVRFSEHIPFYAQISYVVNEDIPETIEDDAYLKGIRFVCHQCPYFVPVLKEDDTPDKRISWGECPYSELGRVKKMQPACEKLFEAITEGEVKICFAD